MKINILDFIDFAKVDTLFEGFNKATGFVTAILDLEGKVLSKSRWRPICTEFHRINPETSKKCTISDTVLASKLANGEKYHFYKCLNGLVDVTIPIVINGEHIANLFSGQFFFEEPDVSFFNKQAETYGFNKENYLKSLENVPVVSKEKVATTMDFLLNMVQLICDMTYQKIEQSQLNEALSKGKEQLSQSEFRFNKMWENGPFGLMMVDQKFQYINVNPMFCEILGYSEAELQQLTFKDISHPDDLVKDLPNIRKLINKEISVYKTEKRYIRKDGQVIWGALTVTANYDNEGQFLYNLAIVEDISRRKLAEEELKKSKQLLSETESIGKVGGWEFNIDTLVTTWTDEVYRIHEVDFDFFHNVDKGINFYTPSSRPIIADAVQRVIEFGEPFDLELEIITAKGNLRTVHTIGKPDLENKRVYGFFQDITERKNDELKLKEAHDVTSSIIKNSPIAIVVTDSTGIVNVWSESAEKMFGWKKEEIIGLRNRVFRSDRFDEIQKLRTMVFEGDTLNNIETECITKSGSLIKVELSASPFRDGHGNIIGILSMARDITGEKKILSDLKIAKEEAEESKIKLDVALSSMTDAIFISDTEGRFIDFNEAFATFHKFKSTEECHRTLAEFPEFLEVYFPTGELAPLDQWAVPRALRGEVALNEVYTLRRKDTGETWIGSYGFAPIRDKAGTIIGSVVAGRDITEQKKIEEKIRQKDQEFRKLSANVPDLIFQFTRKPDGNYCVPIASEGIFNIFGCSPEDVLDDFGPIARVIYPEDAERVIREIEYSADHLTYFTCEFRVHIPGREIQWIYSNSTPERLPDGSVTWYGFNMDITKRKITEEEIRILNETLEQRVKERTTQLEAANRELEAFSYSVSHDLRAPLRHINGYVELLNERFKDNLPEKALHYLSIITNAAKQMGTLIDDLLQFSRTGRQELHKAKFDMNVLINEVLEKIEPDIRNRNITWTIQKLPIVFGDYSLLKQVWVNLLDNAVKYTKFKVLAEITIDFREEKENFVFCVRDNGVGFDMKYATKLFGVFQRLHSQTEFEGTGIGLANVQRIIHKHNGNIWVEAELDKGAKFFFSIPKN